MPLMLAVLEAAVLFCAVYAEAWAETRLFASSGDVPVFARAVTVTLCALAAFHFADLYDLRGVRRFRAYTARLPRALVMAAAAVGLVHFFVLDLRLGGPSWAGVLLFVLALILPLRAAVHHFFGTHPFSRRVLVLGTTALAAKLVREMLDAPDLRDLVVGVVDDGSAAFKPTLPCLRLGSLENLRAIIEGFEPALIVYALPESHDPLVVRELAASRARRIPVEDGVAVYERLTGKIAIEYAAPRAVLLASEHEPSWVTLACARTLSVIVAAAGLIALAPLVLPIALLIKLDSEGPVFFLHPRVGLGGRAFDLVKFRTMHLGGALSEWAADNDHRTTRVGRWLRRFRIDEIPQFWNILQGDMNLVGPRPHPVSNVELFTENIPYYGLRCSVRPGVTGWAQIRYGYANNLSEETEKMRYDLHYIKRMSLGLDLQILFETVKVVLKGGRSATLTDEPGAQVLPIYFGIEHPRRARGTRSSDLPPAAAEATATLKPRAQVPHES